MLKLLITCLAGLLFTSCNTTEQHKGPLNKETTLSIIKPDAVQGNHIGEIIQQFEANHLRVAGIKMVKLDSAKAGNFYAEHKERPFYPELVKFMTSGPVVVVVLEGDDAIAKNRALMGATNPAQASEGTLRRRFARTVSENAVHGSDSADSAKREIAFFFPPAELSERFKE